MKTFRNIFSGSRQPKFKRTKLPNFAVLTTGAVLAFAALRPVTAAAADAWVSCTGVVQTMSDSGQTSSANAKHVLALDDSQHRLYQYSDARKALDPMPVNSYTPNKITWRADEMAPSGMKWEGTIDRKTMEVEIFREDRYGETMKWKEQCEPTRPLIEEPTAQVAEASTHASGS